MNDKAPYNQFALTKEMLETSNVVKNFNAESVKAIADSVKEKKHYLLTGEGSSRIFPAKRAAYANFKNKSSDLIIHSEGATQTLEYELDHWVVFGASNSGKTKEVVRLFNKIKSQTTIPFFGLTATPDTPVANEPNSAYILGCGKEEAVAATKSVVEQGLFYHSLFNQLSGKANPDFDSLANNIKTVLTQNLDEQIIATLAKAKVIHFAGRNNGVAEELALKTNEITRKKSTYLEGTYAVHGIEEVMNQDEVLVIVDPFESEEDKFQECLEKGVGMSVIAISNRKTSFPTILLPQLKDLDEYLQLAAGWSLLVEVGLKNGINLDRPVRARKVGNEFIQS